MSQKSEIQVEGRKLTVSNLDKVLYPEAGFTKGQVIDYYIRIAPVLLPHLRNRPISRLVFDSDAVLKRVKRHGDLFEPLLTLKQRLPGLPSIA